MFVDTLDNVDALGIYAGHQHDLLGAIADENAERIKRQNRRKISVIIGNPPYNAWQENYNFRNANRPYKRVDERIKQTYIKEGNAQNQNSVYDMYTRFVRWASDRLSDDGIICFIMGRKPVSKGAYDGFRKIVEREFSEIWLMDLGGDVRDNPKIAGTTHNVFGIQTGVTIALFVRQKGKSGAAIRYARRPEYELRDDKLTFLASARSIENVAFDRITPNNKHDWLDQANDDWEGFLALADPRKGPGDLVGRVPAVFRLSSNGIETGRDDWLWDWEKNDLESKVRAFIVMFNHVVRTGKDRTKLKLDRQLDRVLKSRRELTENPKAYRRAISRPFIHKEVYFDRDLNAYLFRLPFMFPEDKPNPTIMQLGMAAQAPFSTLATDRLFDFGVLKTGNGRTQGTSRYRYTKSGERVDNITDWALNKFVAEYGKKVGVTKDTIFAYCYGVLHDPIYREKYALNLKREFPRIPFYDGFSKWAGWGQQLLDLHIGYEKVKPFKFVRIDTPNPKRATGSHPKPKLKSSPNDGIVKVDEDTQLTGIPSAAWDYRLGNRSAIDWVLDQHKEKTPRDTTVREKFRTYRFADHKKEMIDLLGRVVSVSLETVKITEAMRETHDS